MMSFLHTAWAVTVELAPWLLLGATIASLLHVALPPGFVQRHLRGRAGVLKAVALGVPLPLCSCGVIPTGLGLKKQGASDGAALGFLISTPQTGVDSILVSASFLGWPFAVFKVVSAAFLGWIGGTLNNRLNPTAQVTQLQADDPASTERRSWRDGVGHGLMVVRTIWRWLVFGIVVSAALSTWLPTDGLSSLSVYGGAAAMGAVLAVSVPLYVCATASVPIAAALVSGGMPLGAALVFLMAGPATNVATVGAVYRAFGGRALAFYLGTIVVGSMGLGMLFQSAFTTQSVDAAMHHTVTAPWAVASAVVLLALFGWFALQDVRAQLARLRARLAPQPSVPTIELAVEGMSCQGCVRKLQSKLSGVEGVRNAEVELEPGRARVQANVPVSQLCAAVEDAGYKASPLDERRTA